MIYNLPSHYYQVIIGYFWHNSTRWLRAKVHLGKGLKYMFLFRAFTTSFIVVYAFSLKVKHPEIWSLVNSLKNRLSNFLVRAWRVFQPGSGSNLRFLNKLSLTSIYKIRLTYICIKLFQKLLRESVQYGINIYWDDG